MKVIRHPAFHDVQRTVEDDAVQAWTDQGWVVDEAAGHEAEVRQQIETKTCPVCGATGDEPCRTKSGAVAEKPHAKRSV